ncbi:kinesin-like protein KIN-UA [Iris pallida]|uniref:Kinesin-like protein n=1 Tax=Iris pallida TaxID=29817 RepID=A0AAX6IA48_IRIPA|nr:kinesin-like protein KIN-UA [Iris pallida]
MASSSRQSSARLDRQIPSAKTIRPKPHARSRSVASSGFSIDASDSDSGRVRVAIRLRPKNAEDLACDSDFIDCVELQPELKRLKLKKNNWSSDSYRFDEVLTETASQRRVYEAVAKPVVESVLNGYNGTVMAYGQTGTGKTYTVGQLGKEDPSERGIMVRALEDILADASPGLDTVRITYLQLYLESIQDLLAPEKTNIPITEDPKTGEVFLPGATMVEIRNLDQFLELLQIGEANRHAANTKLNTESSRSHAILMVHIQRSSKHKEENQVSLPAISVNSEFSSRNVPVLLKSKLLIVDLAGSERVDKSGSEGHMLEEAKFINLSLTSLGKCINALAENSPHIPTRDSKLTRLLRDSFGGTARTSLIVTVGPSARHYSETSSTIMFGQRAMKIVNNLKLKEEFDYESHCRKLEYRVDQLTADIERQQKFRDTEKVEMEERLKECEMSLAEAEKFRSEKFEGLQGENTHLELKIKSLLEDINLQKDQNNVKTEEITRLTMSLKQYKKYQLESSTYQKVLADTTQMHEKTLLELTKQLEAEQSHSTNLEGQLAEIQQHLGDTKRSVQQRVVDELNLKLQDMSKMNDEFVSKIHSLERVNEETLSEKELLKEEVRISQQKLLGEEKRRKSLEDEIANLKKRLSDCCVELEDKKAYKEESLVRSTSGLGGSMKVPKSSKLRETISGQRDTITKIFEEGIWPC